MTTARKRSPWRISVRTSQEAAEAVGEMLEVRYGQSASSYTDARTGATVVSVFVQEEPASSHKIRSELAAELARIRGCRLEIGPGRISMAKVRREDWAESWKRHFRPIEVGERLLIKPSWSRRRGRSKQAVVVLDPGLSFGTGQHPTTAFCLEQLAARRRPGIRQSCLDIGTGSGILAIAAAKLGYRRVEGFDYDGEAVRSARANACRNRVSRGTCFWQGDVTRKRSGGRRGYSVVCANLVSNLLLKESNVIAKLVEPGGLLVLAGILKSEFQEVRARYEAAGWRLVAGRTEKEWRSGAFERREKPAGSRWKKVNKQN
jgi:ribosomal protein L11 methyltransferase